MPFPDSTSASPVFFTDPPDWGSEVSGAMMFMTGIQVARDKTEQRSRRREKPLSRIGYSVPALDTAEFSVRKARSLAELGRPIVVPLWPYYLQLSSMSDADTAAFDISTNPNRMNFKRFKVGSWAYFEESGKTPVFRVIDSVDSGTLTLVTGNGKSGWSGASTAVPSYTGSCLVYPCIVGARDKNESGFSFGKVNESAEMIAIEEN